MRGKLSFFISCNPPKSTAQASHRILKRKDGTQFVGKMQSSKGRHTQDELMLLLMSHKPDEALTGPLKLHVSWQYPWRKAEPKKNRIKGYRYCDTRPDCDNLLKLLQDCMTRLNYWNDDSQIAVLSFSKFWCDDPGIGVEIWELGES